QRAADGSQAIAHVGEASTLRLLVDLEAGAIIEDLEAQAAASLPNPYAHGGSLARVLAGVLECFKAAEIDGRLQFGRVPTDAIRFEDGWNRRLPPAGRHGIFGPGVREQGREDTCRHDARLLQGRPAAVRRWVVR